MSDKKNISINICNLDEFQAASLFDPRQAAFDQFCVSREVLSNGVLDGVPCWRIFHFNINKRLSSTVCWIVWPVCFKQCTVVVIVSYCFFLIYWGHLRRYLWWMAPKITVWSTLQFNMTGPYPIWILSFARTLAKCQTVESLNKNIVNFFWSASSMFHTLWGMQSCDSSNFALVPEFSFFYGSLPF